MLDSTIVRAHQQAATGRKRGKDKDLERSRGGLSTKVHLLANGLSEPGGFRLTGGQAENFAETLPLLAGRQAKIGMADRGYDSNAIVATIESIGATAVIPSNMIESCSARTTAPSTSSATTSHPSASIAFDVRRQDSGRTSKPSWCAHRSSSTSFVHCA